MILGFYRKLKYIFYSYSMTIDHSITITQAKELSLKQTFNKTMSSTINKLFIPRILGNITASTVADVFAAKQLGKIKNIDMRHRKNENNELYSFAFIEIALYDTEEAIALCEDIIDNGSSKVFYDRTNYWEVKSFIPRNNRPAKPSSKVVEKAETEAIRHDVSPRFARNDSLSPDNDENAELEEGEIRDICEELRTPPKIKDQVLEKMTMHSELLHAYNFREMESAYCSNCGCKSNPEYMRTVFWKKYSFCSGWCQYDMETNLRNNWLKSQSHAAQFICPASAKQESLELSAPAVRLEMDDQFIAESSSKFIAMFQRIQEEADQEMQYIRNVCGELMKRPTAFTAEDRTELEKDYENLEKEIMNA